jgi:hypothetical protein
MLTPVIHTLGDEAACIAYVLLLQYIDRYELKMNFSIDELIL